ncbi:hypothetical protein [Candidatus Colwellia aromaticivorans]|uniref:hypothetical protein n=1 Tax=Candidatus Colwellia aromaticivorans TaxID=2267621 RepID=UPI000DF27BC8|nr:hypothetical protein [Candidatus Colwellia aromaticivorans]
MDIKPSHNVYFLPLIIWVFLATVGCTTVDSEEKSYPQSWPPLIKLNDNKCEFPLGTFSNKNTSAKYEYDSSSYDIAPTLDNILVTSPSNNTVTHLRIEKPKPGKIRIRTFALINNLEILIDEEFFDLNKATCINGRFSFVSDTLYPGLATFESEDYNPLVTAAYMVTSFGIGAPISRWWDYRLALSSDGSLIVRRLSFESDLALIVIYIRGVTDDDWFLYKSVDPKKLVDRQNEH